MPIPQFEKIEKKQPAGTDAPTSPDFTKIAEKPRRSLAKDRLFFAGKIVLIFLFVIIIFCAVLGVLYYKNFKQAYNLSFAAKDNLELSIHKVINRDFQEAASLINQANSEFGQAKELLDSVTVARYIPYVGRQLKAVDQLLIAGLKLTTSGEKVVLLIDEITAPLQNESISYALITSEQKKDILNKIVESEDLLLEVQQEIDEAVLAIEAIPQEKLVKPLREAVSPLKEHLPKIKQLIDSSLPMIRVIPKIAGFEEPKSYLFLLQNNSELRPTGGFIGTYGILKLRDGDIDTFDTDNIYNLDRSTQHVIKEPAPWQLTKYLDQKDWSLRDINWAPDFPTTARKAIEMYNKENEVILEFQRTGQPIIGEKGVEIQGVLPYEKNLFGVIAVTTEILGELLKLTGPIVVENAIFTEDNYQDQLELIVGILYQELNIPISERKGIIKKLADEIKIKLSLLPLSRLPEVLDMVFTALDQKQVLIYINDYETQNLILERGWGGEVKDTENDYLFVVDSNLASLKTDQYIDRFTDYSLSWQGDDLLAKVVLTYKNPPEFNWKKTRLRTYTRVYVPLGSQLVSFSGAMENDKIRDPERRPGEVEIAEEFNKTYFGAFISIEPGETGVLTFEYKLPERIKEQIKDGTYNLLAQKQPGVIPSLTLDLKFGKTIKSASPPELESEWFNTSYNYSTALDSDKEFLVTFK